MVAAMLHNMKDSQRNGHTRIDACDDAGSRARFIV